MMKEAIYDLINGKDLSLQTTAGVMNLIMEGGATNAQIAGFLTALRMKGESIDEITACATVMREKCLKLQHTGEVMDIVGTGGDEASTFNISTISAIVVAASGIPVAKHGNRSVSSRCGSADVLEALGVRIDVPAAKSSEILGEIGICFMFAPFYHTSMKYAGPVRKELGVRTVFNILGPLASPAGADLLLLGVYDENLVEPMARVLLNLGVRKAMVVHGHDGLDEVTLCDTTTVCEVSDGQLNSFFITPEQFGFRRCSPEDLVGGDPARNAGIALEILGGGLGPKRDAVVLNSALCIYMARNNVTLKECVRIAQRSIDSGAAKALLEDFIRLSNSGEQVAV
ncbi:MAG: anthranilate phosphoribosyltransferase [Saccharofermentanales bacterium]